MVERSQSVPLNLSVDLDTRYPDKDLRGTKRKLKNAFVQNFHRIASLKLYVRNPIDIPVLESTSRPHSIHLECEHDYIINPKHSPTDPLTILDSLIGEPHRLRKLAIKAVLSHYNFTSLISNLTYLYLTMFSFEGPPRPSLAETLAIIDEAYNLETLYLERIRSDDLDDFTGTICDVPPSASHSKRSTLKRLRLLHLAGGLDCTHFLGYLSFPSSTSVDLDRMWGPVPPAIRQSTMSALSQLFPSSPIRSLVLDQYLCDGSIRDLAYCHELSLAEFRSSSIYHRRERNPPRLRITFLDESLGCSASMKSMYECLPLSRLSTLHLRHAETWVANLKGHIKDSFGALSELHTVSIWGPEIAYDVIPIFGQKVGHDQQVAGSTVLYFPALRRLWLDMWEEKWNPKSDGTSHDLLKQLIGVLSTRKRCGCGIENLVLMNHEEEVSVQGVDRMREVVENVEVYPDRGPLNSGSETE
ncbi:hypothetical protein PQX77_019221 [Marasmius sp. AFHP31]|nr:hypothetical protein PQX77_019221 [Marasmius sp. AFHP31]